MNLKIRRLFPNMPVARYNVAAWQKEEDHLVVVGREVEKPANEGKGEPDISKPDIGKLVLFEFDADYNTVHERVIWEPKYPSLLLEDPRVHIGEKNKLTIGLTAVLKGEKKYEPFPALVRIDTAHLWDEELPPVTIIQNFGPGKNITPMDENKFLFRPDKKAYNHKLILFSFGKYTLREIQDIGFPENLSWADWRIGTTIPPVWLDKSEALFIIHGITIREGKYIYSIGKAKLFKENGKLKVKVHPEPIITPETFENLPGCGKVRELHSFRRVVYATGGLIKKGKKDTLYLYVNAGDTTTFEVGIPIDELKKDLFKNFSNQINN